MEPTIALPVAGLQQFVSWHMSLKQLVSGRQQLSEQYSGLLLYLLVRGEYIAVLDSSASAGLGTAHCRTLQARRWGRESSSRQFSSGQVLSRNMSPKSFLFPLLFLF